MFDAAAVGGISFCTFIFKYSVSLVLEFYLISVII